MNAQSLHGLTPLLVAAEKGKSRIIERLVGYGVNLNTCNKDDVTVLHNVIIKKEMEYFTEFAPKLKEVSIH